MNVNTCGACEQPGTIGWQRWATQEELEAARTDPNVPSVQRHEGEAQIQVLACVEHALDTKLAAHTHEATCTAPPRCDCSVADIVLGIDDDEFYLPNWAALDEIPHKVAGMRAQLADTSERLVYDGSNWVPWSPNDEQFVSTYGAAREEGASEDQAWTFAERHPGEQFTPAAEETR